MVADRLLRAARGSTGICSGRQGVWETFCDIYKGGPEAYRDKGEYHFRNTKDNFI
jgi:hypothetical protein